MQNTGSTHEGDFHVIDLAAVPRCAKRKRRPGAFIAALSLAFTACSTPGPSHAYIYSPSQGNLVHDLDPATGKELATVPAYVRPGEEVVGFGYEPYTDHFFLRMSPGNFVRVVDRPAAAVKRVFDAPDVPSGRHDFAIRSRDRHFFFADPAAATLTETTLYGKVKGRIQLAGLAAPIWGLVYDPSARELLVLAEATSDRVYRFAMDGSVRGEVVLELPVQGVSLGYDPVEKTYFASLADASAIGVFDAQGRLLRRLPRPVTDQAVFIGLGPRSLLRLF